MWFSFLWPWVNQFLKSFNLFVLPHPSPDLILWLFPDFDLSGFVYTPKMHYYTFLKLSPIYLLFQTSLLSFKLKYCNCQAFVFIKTFSMFFGFPMTINLTYLTEEPYDCHHHKSEFRSCLFMAYLPTDSRFKKWGSIHVSVTSQFLMVQPYFSKGLSTLAFPHTFERQLSYICVWVVS